MKAERAGPGARASPPHATRRLMIDLLDTAIMAPSACGVQPWRYRARLGSETIELYADVERTRRYGDPSGRAVHIACGAALFNLRLASAVAGRQPLLRLLPDPAQPRLLAAVRLGGPHRAQRDEIELHRAIFGPGAGRRPLAGRRLPATVLTDFAEAARLEGVLLTFPAGEEVESLPPPADETERTAAGLAGRAGPSQWAVLGTHSGRRADWLRAGQALQRVVLTAAARGITAIIPARTLETAGSWPAGHTGLARDPRLALDPRLASVQPQLVLRFEYASAVTAGSRPAAVAPPDHDRARLTGLAPAPAGHQPNRVTAPPEPAGR